VIASAARGHGARRRLGPATLAAIAVWAGTVAAGGAWLYGYATGPGVQAAAPQSWPAASALERVPHLPTLLVFAHPRCACTRASLSELARIMARAQGRVAAYVVIESRDAVPDASARGELWESARAIPGVVVAADRHGREAALFGAATSGQALLYDADGALRFRGGITAARGHEGGSFGSEAIVALVRDSAAAHDDTPVFGCPLPEADEPGPRGAL
jgi:hypothetical protein